MMTYDFNDLHDISRFFVFVSLAYSKSNGYLISQHK
jgi:hypothetical protein